MSTRILFVTLFVFSSVLSPATAAGWQARDKRAKEKNYRLIVSFTSICCGIDGKAKERVDRYLADYEKRHRRGLSKETVPWGREGEVDYCFDLSRLSGKERNTVISQIKRLVRGSKLTHIEENAPCKSPRNRT